MSEYDKHRETFADDSPRGEHYLDDRTELAYAYHGDDLIAIAYKEKVVREWLDRAWFEVSLTPAGEARCGGERMSEDVNERECPNCGGVMIAESDDRYCLECIHEGRL